MGEISAVVHLLLLGSIFLTDADLLSQVKNFQCVVDNYPSVTVK